MSAKAPASRLCPVSIVMRIGRRRLTLTWRPPRRVARLLERLLLSSWRAIFGAGMMAGASAASAAPAAPPAPAALPTGGALAAGQAAISQSGNRMSIVQGSDKAILNWTTFNIGSQASVTFQQPGAGSVILNRVGSNQPSQLLGSMSGNGKVWLINPAGIMVGQGARIDLHGFVASTLAVHDADFLAGRMKFNATPNAGAVQNYGGIATPSGGSVYLVAPNVENHGIIRAPNGEVILAAGASVELIDTATPGVKVALTGAEGNATNMGRVISEAGRIGMAGVLVKNSGALNASSVAREGGRVFLRAAKTATVDGAGSVAATGVKGGAIEVTGERTALLDSAVLDASGVNGGGTVLMGGGYQGGNAAVRNAQASYAGAGTAIRADASASGDGGKVVLWADGATRAYGAISARGGAQGGDGGLIETSGKRLLDIGHAADASAAKGKAGTWLLDPNSVTIQAGVADAKVVVDPALGPGDYSSSGDGAVISVVTIQTALNNGTSVTITTSAGGAEAGDITLSGAIAKTAGADAALSLLAHRDIKLDGAAAISASAGKLDVNLRADLDGDQVGGVLIETGASVATNGGNITLSGGADGSGYASNAASAGGAGIRVQGSLNAAGGAITLRGASSTASGVELTGGTLAASGGIHITDAASASGMVINNGGIDAGSGAITLVGDKIAIGSSVQGAGGALTIRQHTPGTTIGLAGAAGSLSLSAANFATMFSDGFSGITIGDAGSGAVTVGALTFNDDLTLVSGTGVASTAAVTGAGARLTVSAGGPVALSHTTAAGLQVTAGGAITQTDAFAISGSAAFHAGANPITLSNAGNQLAGTVGLSNSGANNVALAASGDLALGDVSAGNGTLTINAAGSVTQAAGAALSLATNVTPVITVGNGGSVLLANTGNAFSHAPGNAITINSAGTPAAISLYYGSGGGYAQPALPASISGALTIVREGGALSLGSLPIAGGEITLRTVTSGAISAGAMASTGGGITVNSASNDITLNGGAITSTGAQAYTGAVTLAGNTTMSGSDIDFSSTLGSAAANTLSVTANGAGGADNAQFGGAVGGGDKALGALTVIGKATLTGSVTTTGDQSYSGEVTLAANPTLTAGGALGLTGGATGFGDGLPHGLTLAGAGVTTLGGTIGGLAGLASSGAVVSAGASIAAPWTHTGTLELTGGTLQVGQGLTQSGAVTLAGGARLSLTSATDEVFNGAIGGAGNVIKSGAGTTRFNAVNSYTGGTSITRGVLSLGASGGLTASSITVGPQGTLNLDASAGTSGRLTSSGALVGSGTLTAAQGYTLNGGTVSVNLGGGTLTHGAGNTTLSGTFAGDTVNITGGTLTLDGDQRLAGTAVVTVSGGAAFNSGAAETIASLENFGTTTVTGALTLGAGASTNHAGAMLEIGGASGQVLLGAGVSLANGSGGTIRLTGSHAAPLSGGAGLVSAGSVVKTAAGTQTLSIAANEVTGGISVSGGTLVLSGLAANTNSGSIDVASGATVQAAGGTLVNQGTLLGNGSIVANVSNTGALAPGGTGAIGTLGITGDLDTSAGVIYTELSNPASYDQVVASGTVTVGAGTTINRSDLAAVYSTGDVFDVLRSSGTAIAGALPAVSGFALTQVNPSYHAVRLAAVALDNYWIRNTGGIYTSGLWSDAGNWQDGLPTAAQTVHIARPDTLTVTLNGAFGPAAIDGLELGANNTLALAGAAALSLGGGATTLAGKLDIGGGSALVKLDDAGLTLAATGEISGGGALGLGGGTLTNLGKVSPGAAGSAGTLTITGNYAQGASGSLLIDVAGPGAGQADKLAVSGAVALNGNLTLASIGDYAPLANANIAIVTQGGGRSGVFSSFTGAAGYQTGYSLASGEAARVNYVPAATAYFSNAFGTLSWSDAANWSGGALPGGGDSVAIDASLAVQHASGASTVGALDLDGTLAISGGALAVTGQTRIAGAMTLSGDSAQVTLGELAGAGRLTLDGGALTLGGAASEIGTYHQNGGTASITAGTLTTATYAQTNGTLNGAAAGGLTVTSSYSQTGGAITGSMETVDITQATGALALGGIAANTLKASTGAGSMSQVDGTALAVQRLQLAASGAATLDGANTIAAVRGTAGGALSVSGVASVDGALTAQNDIALNAGAGPLAINASVTSNAGNVALVANEIDVYNSSTVRSAGGASNQVSVNAFDAARPIKFSSLASEDSGDGLLLNARDMAAFTTPNLVLGDAAHTGAMTLADGGTIAAPGVTGTVKFINNGTFSRGGGETIAVNGLDISAKDGIALAGENHVSSFSATNSGAGNITFTNNSGLGTLNLGGISNTAGNIAIDNTGALAASGPGTISASGSVSLTAHSPVSVNTAITSGTGISLTASTSVTLGAAARLFNTASAPVSMLARNGNVVVNAAASVNSGGGAITLRAEGSTGTVVAPAGAFAGATPIISSTLMDNAAAEAAAQAAAEAAAAEAAAKAAADKAAAEAAEAAAKAAAEAAEAAAEKAAADAAAKAAVEAAAKAAGDKAAADAAAKAAAEAAAKAATEKAAADAAAKTAADKAAADAAAAKAAAEAAAKAAADKAAADAAAKAAAEAAAKAATDAAAKAAADAAAKAATDQAAADKAAADAAVKAAAEQAEAAAEAAAKAAADKAAAEAAEKSVAAAAAQTVAQEAARQAAELASKAAGTAQTGKSATVEAPEADPAKPGATATAVPAASVLAQVFEQQTVGGDDNSFGGATTPDAAAKNDDKDKKEEKKDEKADTGKARKETKKMAVCK